MFKFIAKVHSSYPLNIINKIKPEITVNLTQEPDGVIVTLDSHEFIYSPVQTVKSLFGHTEVDVTVQYYGNPQCGDQYTEEQQVAYELFCKLYAIHSGESWESLITFFNSHYPEESRESLTQYTSERVRREVAKLE